MIDFFFLSLQYTKRDDGPWLLGKSRLFQNVEELWYWRLLNIQTISDSLNNKVLSIHLHILMYDFTKRLNCSSLDGRNDVNKRVYPVSWPVGGLYCRQTAWTWCWAKPVYTPCPAETRRLCCSDWPTGSHTCRTGWCWRPSDLLCSEDCPSKTGKQTNKKQQASVKHWRRDEGL